LTPGEVYEMPERICGLHFKLLLENKQDLHCDPQREVFEMPAKYSTMINKIKLYLVKRSHELITMDLC
jgi:hypothetical protein